MYNIIAALNLFIYRNYIEVSENPKIGPDHPYRMFNFDKTPAIGVP